ncbi:hypothetical protein J2X90_001651 [Variovorax paradoxus]|uniref:hypothetical protein n=1 Tax=Variovorax paradoxus TaxID=34073 RepID=UPI00278B492F|nr:hypothetical protein [Variovorax paradoxus]MDP9928622.1 hypothetical protein [Variovorax paradoxus]MDQ0023856.1 hypothetical protein [Variovorax paradoxus]
MTKQERGECIRASTSNVGFAVESSYGSVTHGKFFGIAKMIAITPKTIRQRHK